MLKDGIDNTEELGKAIFSESAWGQSDVYLIRLVPILLTYLENANGCLTVNGALILADAAADAQIRYNLRTAYCYGITV